MQTFCVRAFATFVRPGDVRYSERRSKWKLQWRSPKPKNVAQKVEAQADFGSEPSIGGCEAKIDDNKSARHHLDAQGIMRSCKKFHIGFVSEAGAASGFFSSWVAGAGALTSNSFSFLVSTTSTTMRFYRALWLH